MMLWVVSAGLGSGTGESSALEETALATLCIVGSGG